MDKATAQTPPGLEILRVGVHESEDGRFFNFREEDLREIADSYDPELSEAPLVKGHPVNDDPAYGWAQRLFVEGRSLYSIPHQVDAQFAEDVNAGRYKRISSSIYLPNTPGNPKPGKLYLKHIGLHGAAAVSVKGMRAPRFAETADADGPPPLCFSMPLSALGWTLTDLFQRFRDWLIDKEGIEAADRIIPQWQIRSIDEHTRDRDDRHASPIQYAAPSGAPTTETPMSQQNQPAADFAEREQALATQKAALDARAKAIAEREAKALRDDAASFAEQLVQDGKLLPRDKAGAIELLLALPPDAALNFAEADGGKTITKPAGEFLRDLLSRAAPVLNYAEKSADDGAAQGGAANFAAPAGAVVDPAGLRLHKKAVEYQHHHPDVSYIDAVRAVGG